MNTASSCIWHLSVAFLWGISSKHGCQPGLMLWMRTDLLPDPFNKPSWWWLCFHHDAGSTIGDLNPAIAPTMLVTCAAKPQRTDIATWCSKKPRKLTQRPQMLVLCSWVYLWPSENCRPQLHPAWCKLLYTSQTIHVWCIFLQFCHQQMTVYHAWMVYTW